MWRLKALGWRWLPGMLTAVSVAALFKLGFWQPLENLAYTALFQLRGPIAWDERIVVIEIDDASLRQLGQFPWPRQRYVELLKYLDTDNTTIVVFDVIWSEAGKNDQELADAIAAQGQVVLARAWDATGMQLPLVSELEMAAIAIGHIYHPRDPDGITRHVSTQISGEPVLGLAAVEAYTLVEGSLDLPKLDQHLDINWPGPSHQITRYSFAEVVNGEVPVSRLHNKIVFVGATATGIDALRTPFDYDPPTSGVYLHAAIANNLLRQQLLQVPHPTGVLLLLLGSGPALSWLLSGWRQEHQWAAGVGLSLGWGAMGVLLLRLGYSVPIAAPIGLILGTVSLLGLINHIRLNNLLRQQIEVLWQVHHTDMVLHTDDRSQSQLLHQSGIQRPIVQLALLAEQFGRSQSAQAAIARCLSIGLIATNLDGSVWFCNPVATARLNVRVGDRIPSPPVSHWLSKLTWQDNIQILQEGQAVPLRELNLDSHWFEIKLEPLFYRTSISKADKPSLDGILFVIQDVTERREVERLKDEFVSIVSHELRTPLTSIRGSLGLLLTGKLGALSDKGQRMLEIGVNNTDRLIRLINDILDLERIEAGRISLSKETCDAASLMLQAAETMQAMAEKADVVLRVSPLTMSLWADPDRLLQVLTNLLSNAIKFSPAGGTVWLTAQLQLDVPQNPTDPPYLLIQVKDEGRGIPPDKIDAIFERFQQVNSDDARQKGGTGLGLAICRTIVQQHGGRIWAESQPGQGSVFSLLLPRG